MRRYRLAAYAALATLPFTALAACQPGNSSAGGAPAPVVSSSNAGPTSSESDSSSAVPPAAGGGGSNSSFCRQFTKTHTDLVAAAENGSPPMSDAEAEMHQTISAAPADVQQSVTIILTVQHDILTKNPNASKERLDPSYVQAEQSYLAWSKVNC